jgi:ABC-type branched-subunit amino acid transport system substrate-binding protein
MNRRNFLISSALGSAAQLFSCDVHAEKSRSEFVVGQSVDLSGPLQNLGRDYFTGAKIAFDMSNASGGTLGKKWRFIQRDDGSNPAQTVSNVSRLLKEDRADILFGFTGDECVEAVLTSSAFKSSGRLLFAPMSGISLHKDEGKALYVRATYAEEIAALLGQFAAGRMSNFTLVYTPSATNIAARDAALELLRKRNLPEPALLTLKEDGSNASALATGIGRSPPHAIVILADTVSAALFARQLRPRTPGLFIAITSSVDPTALQQILGAELSFGLVVSRVVPNPDKGMEKVVREFSRALAKYMDEMPTAASLEGYIAARALIEIAHRSADTAGTPQSLQGVRNLDLGGWSLDFGRGERASHYVDTSMITRKGSMLG